MLIVRVPPGRWVKIIDEASGRTIEVAGKLSRDGQTIDLVFKDDPRNFRVVRDDRRRRKEPS